MVLKPLQQFASDNNAGMCPEALAALVEAAIGAQAPDRAARARRGLDHGHGAAGLLQAPRRHQAGDARADDHDIGVERAGAFAGHGRVAGGCPHRF